MENLGCIVYVSTANWLLTRAELESLLQDARDNNQRHGITGTLLYSDGTFLQYFEGPRSSLPYVYDRIRNSRQHRNIVELCNEAIPSRRFADWSMGYLEPSRSDMQHLASHEWWGLARDGVSARSLTEPAAGMGLLSDFCDASLRSSQAGVNASTATR